MSKPVMITATKQEIEESAHSAGLRDQASSKTDPHGGWNNYRSVYGLWNSSTPEEAQRAAQERPLAYRVYVTAYLRAQGWERT